jgi:CheY-like chemotaxis protein
MGGDLTLAATGPLGSTFRLELPLPVAHVDRETEAAATMKTQRLRVRDTSQPTRVLVVDDNPANRYVVEAYLEELGAIAVLVESADLGLQELARKPFDLVLMDVQMPGKDGYQATREIRNDLGLTVPVIAMTANANLGERGRCEAAGMDDLLVKPFDTAALADLLNRNLSRVVMLDESGVHKQAAPVADEPLLDAASAGSIVQRFTGRPATLRKLYSALQESIAMHLEALRTGREGTAMEVAPTLHGLKGAAGMYGARRLQTAARTLEGAVLGGADIPSLADEFDALERTGRETLDEVHRLLESLAVAADGAGA